MLLYLYTLRPFSLPSLDMVYVKYHASIITLLEIMVKKVSNFLKMLWKRIKWKKTITLIWKCTYTRKNFKPEKCMFPLWNCMKIEKNTDKIEPLKWSQLIKTVYGAGSVFIFLFFIFTTAGFKCCVAPVKKSSSSQCCCFSGPSGSMTPIHLVLRTEYHLCRR